MGKPNFSAARIFLITSEEVCGECKGDCVLQNKDWIEYTEFENQIKKQTGEDFPMLWESHGKELDDWWLSRGMKPYSAPEEFPCEGCNGTGKIRREIELTEALLELSQCATEHPQLQIAPILRHQHDEDACNG